MFKLLSIAFIFLCACGDITLAFKILIVCVSPTKSHNNIGKGVAELLQEAKHEVTFITPFPQKHRLYREIGIPEILTVQESLGINFEMFAKANIIDMHAAMPIFMKQMAEKFFESKKIQQLLNDQNEKFDLVAIEYFINDVYIGLGVKFNCPVILISSTSPSHWLTRLIGNPISPSTVPNGILAFNKEMTFTQRLTNTAMAVFQEIYGALVYNRIHENLYTKYFPEECAKVPFSELYKKIALTFSNSHPSIGHARPLLPNVIEIAGYHLNRSNSLPKKYQMILDNAKYGVILFSMGSNINSADIPDKVKEYILKALGKRKETVLWKYEKNLRKTPNNVIIKKWMPQSSILSHPKVKLFITHGGFLSTIEAAEAGIPVLALPVFADQFHNAQQIQDRECGLYIHFDNLTESSLTWALTEVIDNPKYTTSAKKTRELFYDRPMDPKDMIVFYTEHVIRTGGGHHFSAPYLPLYASLLLDVIGIFLIPPLVLLLFIRCLCKCCRKASSDSQSQRKERNTTEQILAELSEELKKII